MTMAIQTQLIKPPLLTAHHVSVSYKTKRGMLQAVNEASFTIEEGESVALIGESGCGKTTLATTIVSALPYAAMVTGGRILYQKGGESIDLLQLSHKHLRPLLWSEISMVFQASQSSFNPVRQIKTQFLDTVRAQDRTASRHEILEKARELLSVVMLDPDKVLNAYPHELSGGMKQRTLIALSLLLDPRLIILDEPTTALDLLTQEKILTLLRDLKKQHGFSLLFITHDLGIVSELADKVVTMYAGRVVEHAPVKAFFTTPRHPYSKGLIDAIPRLTTSDAAPCSIPGTPPDMIGCRNECAFMPRCSYSSNECAQQSPALTLDESGLSAFACFNPVDGGTERG
jgi:peptide/nickel transport system ATP-binding protein